MWPKLRGSAILSQNGSKERYGIRYSCTSAIILSNTSRFISPYSHPSLNETFVVIAPFMKPSGTSFFIFPLPAFGCPVNSVSAFSTAPANHFLLENLSVCCIINPVIHVNYDHGSFDSSDVFQSYDFRIADNGCVNGKMILDIVKADKNGETVKRQI